MTQQTGQCGFCRSMKSKCQSKWQAGLKDHSKTSRWWTVLEGKRKKHTGFSLGVTSDCPGWTPPARLDPTCMNAQHTRERIRMNQGETACPSFKMKSLPYAFTKQNKQNTEHTIRKCSPHTAAARNPPRDLLAPQSLGNSGFWSTAEDIWWGNQADDKSQNKHFMSISYHFPSCCFDSLLIPKAAAAVESSPCPVSLSLCCQYLGHAAVHLLFVPATCLLRLVLAVSVGVQMSRHTPCPCFGFTNHCATITPPGLALTSGYPRPEGNIPTQTLLAKLEILLPCFGEVEFPNRLCLLCSLRRPSTAPF